MAITIPSTVEQSLRDQVGHLAAYKKALVAAVAGRGNFWQIVQNSNNEAYIDRVQGNAISIADGRLDDIAFGDKVVEVMLRNRDYFIADMGMSGSWTAALNDMGWRAHEYFGDFYKDAVGQSIAAANLYPREDFLFGYYSHNPSVLTKDLLTNDSDLGSYSTISSKTGPGKIVVKVVSSPIGGSNLVLAVKALRADKATVEVVSITIPSGSIVGYSKVLGQTTVDGSITAGDTDFDVDTGTGGPFQAGEKLHIYESGVGDEVLTIDSVNTDTITVADDGGVKRSYTTAAKVTPLFGGIKSGSSDAVVASGGNSGDKVTFSVDPDRVVTLAYTQTNPYT